MKTIKVQGKEYVILEKYSELSFNQYILLTGLEYKKNDEEKKLKKEFNLSQEDIKSRLMGIEESYMESLVDIICSLTEEDINTLTVENYEKHFVESVHKLLQTIPDTLPMDKVITLNNINYVWKPLGTLSMGEKRIIDKYRIKYPNENAWPYIVSVLLRPDAHGTIEILDPETVEPRAELFRKELKAINVAGPIGFFLSGWQKVKRSTKLGSKENKK